MAVAPGHAHVYAINSLHRDSFSLLREKKTLRRAKSAKVPARQLAGTRCLRQVTLTKTYRRAVRLPMDRDRSSKNLLILSEADDMTLKESFNLLITKANVFSALLKTVHFEPFLPIQSGY